jgi:hypothetical protein
MDAMTEGAVDRLEHMTSPDIRILPALPDSEPLVIYEESSEHLFYFPLNLISFKAWKPERYIHNKELITEHRNTKPIDVGDRLDKDGKFMLGDGNHRCTVASELGYTHVPAYILKSHWIKHGKLHLIKFQSLERHFSTVCGYPLSRDGRCRRRTKHYSGKCSLHQERSE